MKNIMSNLIVIFSLFSFQLAQAAGDCNDPSLQFKLSDLKFLNQSFTGLLSELGRSQKCTLVRGISTGQAALSACAKLNAAVVNPGNPQYVGEGHGDLLNNDLNYYFCMPAGKKKPLCDHMATKLAGTMDVTWGRQTQSDGDCLCKRKGDPASALRSCPADITSLQTGNSTECNDPLAKKDPQTNKCVCLYKPEQEFKTGVVCPDKPEEVVADSAFDKCLEDVKAAQDSCSEKGKAALDKCSKDAPEVNKNISEAQRVLGIGLDALVAKNAGSGALEACTKMSTMGTGVIEALSLLRNNCKKELNNCKKSCEDVKAFSEKSDEEFVTECKAKLGDTSEWSETKTKRYLDLAKQYQGGAENAEKFCKGDVQNSDGQLGDFLENLALSVQKADICRCQLTAANIDPNTCESIVTPLTCIQNPNANGCQMSTVGCAPNSQIGNCKLNTTPAQVAGSGVKAPISGFAGGGFGSGGSGTGAGKTTIDTSGLDGLYDETRPTASATATADAGSPFGAAQAVGGVGGGGGGGGGGEGGGGGGESEGDGKGGLSAFFQNAKGSIANMFGGGSGDRSAPAKKGADKTYKNDMNGFRPKTAVRGMANETSIGGKNRDIWKIMNERYSDQNHTFITVENPTK